MKKRICVIEASSSWALEADVNEFLKMEEGEVVDIKFVITGSDKDESYYAFITWIPN